MSRLWLFNPWNDMAIATDSRYYTPPANAIRLEKSGESLPMWMAPEDDYVLAGEAGKKFFQKFSKIYTLAKPWEGEPLTCCIPWGWSTATREYFLNSGVSADILPDDCQLAIWKQLSHRRITIAAHKFLGSPFVPIEAKHIGKCVEVLHKWGDVIGKYPWSTSGRGLFSGTLQYEESFIKRCLGAIRHQGSVMIEPFYDVVKDFAMLFMINNVHDVNFIGFSLFENNKRAYTGNILIPQKDILAILSNLVKLKTIESLKVSLSSFIKQEIAPYYNGPVGVDMFVYRDSKFLFDNFKINPCVEINLRYTMGFVALELQKRFLPTNFTGKFVVSSEPPVGSVLNLNAPDSPFHFYVKADSM